MTELTDEAVKALLEGASTAKPIITKCPCGHPYCTAHLLSTQGSVGFEIGDAELYAAAHDLARALLDARVDAQVAVALVVEQAAEMAREGFMIVAPEGVGQRQALDSYRAQISGNIMTLAPADGLAAVEALRKEAYREGWRFAYRQCEATGSVPDPDYKEALASTPPADTWHERRTMLPKGER